MGQKLGVVIPSYKVRDSILKVISEIGPEVDRIIVIDDFCPQKSGQFVEENVSDPRVKVIYNEKNLGVGGSVLAGYSECFSENVAIAVKIDGDGQMKPSEILDLVRPILEGKADYSKGNRFHYFNSVRNMPKSRILGNLVLSFFSKLSTGYWQIFDPTNGYTAMSKKVYTHLEVSKISKRYFFESDILHHLYLQNAVIADIPMEANYGDEKSNLRIWRVIPEFLVKHTRNTFRRIIYSYYIRDFTLASIQLPVGLILLTYGVCTAIFNYFQHQNLEQPTPTGTLILITMSVLSGLQFILSFFAYDIHAAPRSNFRKNEER